LNLRHPPGRAGRLWLQHRQEVATRGADLLDKKRHGLVQEHRRLVVLARGTHAEWDKAAREAELWINRAAVMAGEEQLAILAAKHRAAEVTVRWRSSMGLVFASEASVELGAPAPGAAGGSAATDLAMAASRRAVEAAVKDAVARSALARVAAELAVTSRRQRALEHRWLPALDAALTRLNESLDELEREEGARAFWVRQRQAEAVV
jgi:V/A-type H+-transporting ATPase subunit D